MADDKAQMEAAAAPAAQAADAPAAPSAVEKSDLSSMSMDDLKKRVEELEETLSAVPKVKSKVKQKKYTPKTPLGMRDYMPEEMAIREEVFTIIRNVLKRHGAVSIETPVAELKETLTGKYGEDSKLIYDLADQGGEILALRYDLTVPFARFCAEHGIEQIKRYHIARVYRRDKPAMTLGRYREFYQCDIDIAGEYEPMVPDAECVKIVTEVLTELRVGDFVVKMNHRKILDGIFEVCGVPEHLFRPICSAVDKLDKLSWEDVKKEMIEKGIDDETAEQIWVYAQRKGGRDLVNELLQDEKLCANANAKEGLDAMLLLFKYAESMAVPENRISFDLSLARGLDYYTGVIYEAVLVGAQVGSVSGGGRYDELVGMFLAAKSSRKKSRKIPCVGVSLGLERLFVVVAEQRAKENAVLAAKPTQVLVAGIASAEERYDMLHERLKLCSELWAAGIRAETPHKTNTKFMTLIQRCEKEATPICVVIGKSELEAGKVNINIIKPPPAERVEEQVDRAGLIDRLKELLQN
mmetsp:Transcript_19460/g.35962  ORF Transcript_19460/g.35962 Transcript_19460/m.35962 type:complete len:524 (-) Transcript_19460:50-1621(-)